MSDGSTDEGGKPFPEKNKVKETINGKTKEGGQSQKKKVEKPQDGCQKSGQNIENPYQMEDNKNPKGAAPKAPPCCLPFGKDFLCFAPTWNPRALNIRSVETYISDQLVTHDEAQAAQGAQKPHKLLKARRPAA